MRIETIVIFRIGRALWLVLNFGMVKDDSELPIGREDQESAEQVEDEFAALAVKIVMKETPEAPVLAELASTKLIPSKPS
jgi:hypothetical protein